MSVKITSRTYKDDRTGQTTDWMLGNVGDWKTLTIECEAAVDFYASDAEKIEVNQGLKTLKLNNGKTWHEYGFDAGLNCDFKSTYTDEETFVTLALNCNFNILLIYGDTMEVDALLWDLLPFPFNVIASGFYPAQNGQQSTHDVRVVTDVEPEGLELLYNHLTNEDSPNNSLFSIIDGATTKFNKPNVLAQTIGSFQPMQPVGMQSGMSVRNADVKRLGQISGEPRYKYEIKLQFQISSFFNVVSDYLAKIKPDYLDGLGSLTDNFKVTFRPKWNNPNTAISNDLTRTQRLGNTGWFNENYNELINNFTVESVNYFNASGQPVTSLDYFAPIKAWVIISGVPNVTTATRGGFGFMWIPSDDADYKNKATPFYRNTFINTGSLTNTAANGYQVGTFYPAVNVGGGIGAASMNTRNVKFTDLGGGRVLFEAIFEPTLAFFNLFDAKAAADRNYALWVSIADQTLAIEFSDRVSLLADVNLLQKTIPAAGPYPFIQNKFLEHQMDEYQAGTDDYYGFLQDDILCRLPFQVDHLTTKLNKMRFGIEVYNPSTSVSKVLEKFDVDLTSYPLDANGIPQYNFNTTRGFKLENGNNKNWVRINRDPAIDGSGRSGFMAYYAFKIRYEDWISLANVPADFFDATLEHNGANNNWLHYLMTIGWVINFYTEVTAETGGNLAIYKNVWPFLFDDYDKNTLIDKAITTYRNLTPDVLQAGVDPDTGYAIGIIVSNEPTRIEIAYHINDGGVWDADVYSVTTIEITRGGGEKEMRQLSTVWGYEADNPLRPMPGETKLSYVVIDAGTTLVTSCLVDPNLLTDAVSYRITGRIGCSGSGSPITFGKYEDRYEASYE